MGKHPRSPEPTPAVMRLERTREPGLESRGYIQMDRNERLAPLPRWFLDNIRAAIRNEILTSYPTQDELRHTLCDVLKTTEDRVLLTAGSDAAIKAVFEAYVRPSDAVVMLDPSYAMYPVYATMYEARRVSVAYDSALHLDPDMLLGSIRPGVRLVVLANPNQPTGTMLDTDVIHELLRRTQRVGALVVVDEAYFPFSRSTLIQETDQHPHVAILRSFSKAAGLAGLRIGYVVAHPAIVSNLYKVRSANDVNAIAILCASEILRNPAIISEYVSEVEGGRRVLTRRLRSLSLVVLPSHTNFALIRFAEPRTVAAVVAGLRERRYLVKGPFSHPAIEDCLRVTLGPPKLMESFGEALASVVAELRPAQDAPVHGT